MEELTVIQGTALQAAPGFDSLLDSFAAYIDVKEITEKSYGVALRCFAEWLRSNGITRPQRADILAYKKYLAEPHERRQRADRQATGPAPVITFTAGTQARYMRAVKRLFAWAESEHLYENIASGIKGAKCTADNTKRDAFLKEDAITLLDSIDRTDDAGKRDYAMILLSITCGLRIIEIQRADIGDLETVNKERVIFVQGKGRDEKDEYKKLPPAVYAAILDYLDTRSTKDKAAPLFAGIGNRSRGRRLAEPSISRIIKDRMKAAGYDTHKLSAHSLRHSSVTFLLEAGATIQEAQHHARHASPETTTIYAHNIDRKKQHTEQRIYNFLFDVEEDPATKAANFMRNMTGTQQARALELLEALAG